MQLVDWLRLLHNGAMGSRLKCGGPTKCLYCYEAQKGRAVYRGHLTHGLRVTHTERGESLPLPRKTDPVTGSTTSSSGVLAPGLLGALPELWAFLTSSQFPDGSKRLPGKISFSCVSQAITLSLTDPETNSFVSRSGKDLDALLLLMEQGLAEGTLDFMTSRYPQRGRK